MSDISPSALGESFDAEFEAKVVACSTAAEISELMRNRSVAMGLTRRDIYSPDLLIPVGGPVPQRVGRVVRLNGVAHSLVADTEADLLAQENALYRKVMAQPAATTETAAQLRTERGQFVRAEDATEKAELELAFKRGDISASDYLERSGAVADYLEKAGVPLEDLKSTIQEKQGERFEKSWAQATEEFLHSPEGADWPGGARNLEIVGNLIAQNSGLMDQPCAKTLAAVWAHMKQHGLAVENEEVALTQRISEATNPYDLRAILQPGSSSLFGM